MYHFGLARMDQEKESTSCNGVASNHVPGWPSSIYRWTGIRGLGSGGGGTECIKSTVLLRLVGYVRGCFGVGRYDCGLRAR